MTIGYNNNISKIIMKNVIRKTTIALLSIVAGLSAAAPAFAQSRECVDGYQIINNYGVIVRRPCRTAIVENEVVVLALAVFAIAAAFYVLSRVINPEKMLAAIKRS
jgi:hypothetical protein